jgi:hypothetical protein
MTLRAGRPSRGHGMDALKAKVRGDVPRKVRLNVNMDEDLYWELKRKALEERATVTDVVIRLVTRHVRRGSG